MSVQERTLIIIKPDAFTSGHTGKIIDRIIQENFNMVAMKQIQLSLHHAKLFYKEHENQPFYNALTNYMISSPVVVACLEKDNAVQNWRNVIGVTNPAEAEAGTIRKEFGKSKSENAVHGSDSIESAQREISFFFNGLELGH